MKNQHELSKEAREVHRENNQREEMGEYHDPILDLTRPTARYPSYPGAT